MTDKVKLAPPRKPDYHAKAMDKAKGEKSLVGAAWQNPNGSISIKIDPFVVLHGGADLLITLFPIQNRKQDE